MDLADDLTDVLSVLTAEDLSGVLVSSFGVFLLSRSGDVMASFGVLVASFGVLLSIFGVLLSFFGVLVARFGVLVGSFGVLLAMFGISLANLRGDLAWMRVVRTCLALAGLEGEDSRRERMAARPTSTFSLCSCT